MLLGSLASHKGTLHGSTVAFFSAAAITTLAWLYIIAKTVIAVRGWLLF
ncbi:hypothetical protein ABIB66_007789 [Bradyrhizobium sp. F1.13.3]